MANNSNYLNSADSKNYVQIKQELETDVNHPLTLTEVNGSALWLSQEVEGKEVDQLLSREELYAGHMVQVELVIGPEVLHQHPAAQLHPAGIYEGTKSTTVLQADLVGVNNENRMKLDTKIKHDNNREWEGYKEHKLAIMKTENVQGVEIGVKGILSDRYLDPDQDSHIADSVEDITINDEVKKNTNCSRNECKYQTVTSETLNRELRLHETIRYFVCDSCGLTLHSKQHLVKHINLCQAEPNDAFDIFKPKYSHKNYIKPHHKVQSKVKHKLINNSLVKKRFSKHSGKKSYSCAHCKYSCIQRSNLKVHLRTHTGEKPYNCTYCQYSCNRSGDLKRHLRTHTGEKPYTCTYCQYSFSRSDDLKQHLRMHTGEKPYTCTYCEYSFSRACHLKRHERKHTGEKPFTCTYCEYSCSRSGDLKQHIRTHTGEKPFNCTYCKYSCSQRSNLKVHIRMHTSKKI